TRLLSLTRGILPSDPRYFEWIRMQVVQGKEGELRRDMPQQRVGEPAGKKSEILGLVLGLPIWIILGQLGWLWLRNRTADVPVHAEIWRTFLAFVGCLLLLISLNVFFTIWRYATMTKAEAHMILQDAQWLAMRNEQRLMSRWLAWMWRARRSGLRKEPS